MGTPWRTCGSSSATTTTTPTPWGSTRSSPPARGDRSVPLDWTNNVPDDVWPAGYGSTSASGPSAQVEIRVPASEVSSGDYLLVSGSLYGEVRGGHWNGAFAASELAQGFMTFEMIGGDGVPQNPLFLSVPEPDGAPIAGAAAAALSSLARRRPRLSAARCCG